MKGNNLVASVLAVTLSQATFVSSAFAKEGELKTTTNSSYVEPLEERSIWGVGLGTVFGAIVGGPPGAIIGGTLGATIGWGQDQVIAGESNKAIIDSAEQELELSLKALSEHKLSLNQKSLELSRLQKTVDQQSARLSKFEHEKLLNTLEVDENKRPVLPDLIEQYLSEIYFHHGESSVPDYAQDRLAGLANFLNAYPSIKVNLKAHTDKTGDSDLNIRLSESRAGQVKQILVDQGIAAERVSIDAQGEANANTPIGDVPNYVLDRRVAIELKLGDEPLSFAGISEVAQ